MDTLLISVSDFIGVKDVILRVRELFTRAFDFFLDKNREFIPQEPERVDEGRSPPTLGINLQDMVKVKEALR